MNNEIPNRAIAAPHHLNLENRQKLTLTGITEIESFDETVVVLHTAADTLIIRGDGLHLRSLDGEQVLVDGSIGTIAYEALRPTGGFFSRLFG